MPELDLAINSGIRNGNQYDLPWGMVDWKCRMLDIPRTKNEEAIHVPLNDAAIAALEVVHARGDGKGRGAHLGPNKLHAVVSLLGATATGGNGTEATTSQVVVQ